jgi:hypothetical protein
MRIPKINEWRNKPFQPHLVARGRPTAYMMRVAMTYIKILQTRLQVQKQILEYVLGFRFSKRYKLPESVFVARIARSKGI